MMMDGDLPVYCGFCCKPNSDVELMIASSVTPSFICNNCVADSAIIIEAERNKDTDNAIQRV